MTKKSNRERERINWHRVTFWSSLGIAIVYFGLSRVREDHRIITIFEEEGQRMVKNHIRYGHPELSKWLGLGIR